MRLWLGVILAALVALGAVASRAAAAGGSTFEDLRDDSEQMDELVQTAGAAVADCRCDNEFEVRECRAEKAKAAAWLRARHRVHLEVDGKAFKLGRYNFKTRTFPVTVAVDLPSGELTGCDRGDDDNCAGADDPDDKLIVTAAPWSGSIAIPDEDLARALRDSPDALAGEIVVQVEGVSERFVESQMAAAKRAAMLRALGRVNPARVPDHLREEYQHQRKCAAKMKTRARHAIVRLKVVGVRVWTNDSPEYLVSVPSSAMRLSEQRAAAAALRRKGEEEAARQKAAAAAQAPTWDRHLERLRAELPALRERLLLGPHPDVARPTDAEVGKFPRRRLSTAEQLQRVELLLGRARHLRQSAPRDPRSRALADRAESEAFSDLRLLTEYQVDSDRALFLRLYLQPHDGDAAMRTMRQRFPRSPFRASAELSLAVHALQNSNFVAAAQAFAKIPVGAGSATAAYARYLGTLCQFKLGKQVEAIAAMAEFARAARTGRLERGAADWVQARIDELLPAELRRAAPGTGRPPTIAATPAASGSPPSPGDRRPPGPRPSQGAATAPPPAANATPAAGGRADEPPQINEHVRARARKLFLLGLQFFQSPTSTAAACKAFEDSRRLDPQAGTVLHLGMCRERMEQIGAAWRAYNEALVAAEKERSSDRAKLAQVRLDSLKSRVYLLTIKLAPGGELPDLALTLNGGAIDDDARKQEIVLREGTYTLIATAPGRVPWGAKVSAIGGQRGEVVVPVLAAKKR